MEHIIPYGSKLEYIDISHNNQFTDESIRQLLTVKTLKYINLQGLSQLTDNCFYTDIDLPNIEELIMNGVWNITDNGILECISYIKSIIIFIKIFKKLLFVIVE